MKNKLLIFVLICILFLPTNVLARCSDKEIIRLQKISNNISESKTYREENGRVVFDITLTNMTNDVYIYDFIKRTNIYYTGGPITMYGYNNGTTVSYMVKSNLNNCRGETIRNLSVVLPAYNPYYTDELCDGISSYELCNKWYNTRNLTYADFEKQVKAYIKRINEVPEPEPIEPPKKSWQEIAFELFAEYYIIILVPIIIIAGGGIYILKKNEEIV